MEHRTGSSENTPPGISRRQTAMFWAFGGLKLAVLIWLGWHAFPLCTADELGCKQPGYMYLHGGPYSIPTFAGVFPHAELLFAFYGPLDIVINGALFQSLGFNRWASLGGDMAVHMLISGLLAAIVWRTTKNAWWSGLYWLGTTYLISPIGRPEEMGLLCGTLAVLSAGRRIPRWVLATVLLGLTGSISPVTAVVASLLVVVRLWFDGGWNRSFVLRAVGTLLLAPSLTIAIFCWYVSPYFREAWEQFRVYFSVAYRQPFGDLLRDNLLFFVPLTLFGLIACGLTIQMNLRRRRESAPSPPWLGFVNCLLVISLVGIGLAALLGRPLYDYRWIGYLLPAAAIVLLVESGLSAWSTHRWRSAIATGGLALALALPNRDVLRYCLAPILWHADSVTYADAVETVNRVVPSTATIGGDPAMWMAVTDGRPFLAIRWIGSQYWPEYLVSTSFARKPYVLQREDWENRIKTEYDEIPLSWPAAPSNHLTLGWLNVPIFYGEADWRIRIWKRHASPSPNSPSAANGTGADANGNSAGSGLHAS